MGKGPDAPDPYQTAAAQTQSNQQTAAYNAALNRVSQYTPYGNSVYSQTGTDTTGAPTYRNDITLTPEAQQQLDNQLKQNNELSNIGFTLADQAKASLANPINTNGLPALQGGVDEDFGAQIKQAQDAAYSQATSYLDPQFQNQQSDLDAKLANQGVVQGSEAYQRAQDELARQKTFAYNQAQDSAIQTGNALQNQLFGQGVTNANLSNSARAQGLQEQTSLATLPLNQLNALRSGTQIQNPQFTAAPQSNSAGTDVAGIINNSYQQQVANSNNFMNGLFGLGSAGIMASDRRLKRDIYRIGRTAVLKLPLYAFRYLWDDVVRVGVMAQDVVRVKPNAVIRVGKYLAVDYAAIS